RREHLGHARTAAGSFVPDDDDVASLNLAALEPAEHLLLGVVDPGGARKALALLAGDLGHGALGREVAVENLDVTGPFDRFLERRHDVLPGSECWRLGKVPGKGSPGDGHAVAVEQPALEEIPHDGGRAADAMQVLLDVSAARFQIREVGHAVADAL